VREVGKASLKARTIERLAMCPVLTCHVEVSRGMTCGGMARPSSSSRVDRSVSRTAFGTPHRETRALLLRLVVVQYAEADF